MSGDKKVISVVVPVFNENAVIDVFYQRLDAVLDAMSDRYGREVIFVDDGSSDGSFEMLTEIADRDPSVRIVKFSRNFGHQVAITAGIDAATGDAVVVIDADLQDPLRS